MTHRPHDDHVTRLIDALHPDARRIWDHDVAERSFGIDDRAAELHRRLGAIGRRLRTEWSDLPLHAAACQLPDGRGLIAAGASGSGKSSLVGLLGVHRGAAIVSDDTVWMDASGDVRGFGGPLTIRSTSPLRSMLTEADALIGTERSLARPDDLGMVVTDRCTPTVVLFPNVVDEPPTAMPISPAESFARLSGALLRDPTQDEWFALAGLVGRSVSAVLLFGTPDGCIEACDEAFHIEPSVPSGELFVAERLDDGMLERMEVRSGVWAIRFGDAVVLWDRGRGRTVCIDHWPAASALPDGDARRQLGELELLTAAHDG